MKERKKERKKITCQGIGNGGGLEKRKLGETEGGVFKKGGRG